MSPATVKSMSDRVTRWGRSGAAAPAAAYCRSWSRLWTSRLADVSQHYSHPGGMSARPDQRRRTWVIAPLVDVAHSTGLRRHPCRASTELELYQSVPLPSCSRGPGKKVRATSRRRRDTGIPDCRDFPGPQGIRDFRDSRGCQCFRGCRGACPQPGHRTVHRRINRSSDERDFLSAAQPLSH